MSAAPSVPIVRSEVTFTSGGERCAAWWYGPAAEPDGRVIVMANGFSLTRHDGLPAYAERFAAAGFAVLLFDHRNLGDSGGARRQRFRASEQQEDWRNAIAYAGGREEVEPGGIVLWGYSFAGGHVLEVASRRDDLAAVIVLCPFADGFKRVLATPPRLSAWMLPRAVADVAGHHNLVPVTAPPGEHGAMSLPGEAEGFAAAVEPGSPWRNEISPGVFATVAMFRPVRRARRIAAPLWAGLGERDITVDGAAIERVAARAPRGELHRYAYDHFEPLGGDAADRIAADQLDFLARAL
ncbi:MAG: alpha/beta fold hydrolase [Solirubrobacterales bacterium]